MQTFHYLHAFIKDLDKEGDIYSLLKEVEAVTEHSLSPYEADNMQVGHYLQEVRLRKEIKKDSLDAIPLSKERFLWQKLLGLQDTNPEIFELCQEIGRLRNTGVEKANYYLYAFLSRHLKENKRKPTKKIPLL